MLSYKESKCQKKYIPYNKEQNKQIFAFKMCGVFLPVFTADQISSFLFESLFV